MRLDRGRAAHGEELRVDGWIDDVGRPIIVSVDPPRNMLGNSDIAVGPTDVPAREPAHRHPVDLAPDPPDPRAAEVRVELVPGIPHRCEAVAEVARPAHGDDRLRGAVARAHQHIVAVQIELLDRDRKQRQIVPVDRTRQRETLDARGPRAKRLEVGADAPGRCSRVKSRAPGRSSTSASSALSPLRIPVSQSWISATRRVPSRAGEASAVRRAMFTTGC